MNNQNQTVKNKIISIVVLVALSSTAWGQYNYATNADETITITRYTNLLSGDSVIIPDTLDGRSVTAIGDSAFNSAGVTNVTLGTNITRIGTNAFMYCNNLTSVTLGNHITNIGAYAFNNCIQLAKVKIPASVSIIGDRAFEHCYLSSVLFLGNRPAMGSAVFANQLTGGAAIYYSTAAAGWDAYTPDNWSWLVPMPGTTSAASGYGCSTNAEGTLTITAHSRAEGSLSIPYFIDGRLVTGIGAEAFKWHGGLTGVVIPDTVANIGANAFQYSGLVSVTLGKGVNSIGDSAFDGCGALTSVTIPAQVISMGQSVFRGTVITNAVIEEGAVAIVDNAFMDCGNLLLVSIPDSVQNIGANAFNGCSALKSMTISGYVWSIGYRAFMGCYGLTNVTIVPWYNLTIGREAFSGCRALANMDIPNSVTSLGENCFESCSSLKSVTLSTNLTSLPGSAFTWCAALQNITVPASITSIGQYAFAHCSSLEYVRFLSAQRPTIEMGPTSAFDGDSTGVILYYPAEATNNVGSGWPGALPVNVTQILPWAAASTPAMLAAESLQANHFGFTITGSANATAVVETSTNLINWIPVSTNTLVNGTSAFTDASPATGSARFYRVKTQ